MTNCSCFAVLMSYTHRNCFVFWCVDQGSIANMKSQLDLDRSVSECDRLEMTRVGAGSSLPAFLATVKLAAGRPLTYLALTSSTDKR